MSFQAGESVDDRGVELLFDHRHIGHGVADDFRRILDVMERAHPGHLGRKVIGSRRAGFGCFHRRRAIVLAREKWRLEALHLVGALQLFNGLFWERQLFIISDAGAVSEAENGSTLLER